MAAVVNVLVVVLHSLTAGEGIAVAIAGIPERMSKRHLGDGKAKVSNF